MQGQKKRMIQENDPVHEAAKDVVAVENNTLHEDALDAGAEDRMIQCMKLWRMHRLWKIMQCLRMHYMQGKTGG